MCCFSGPVKDVSGTKIFARLDGQTQLLAYAMQISAEADLAMILPIPTPPGSAEDAVKFVNLEKYPGLFDDLWQAFAPRSRGLSNSKDGAPQGAKLQVHSVGAFEASFVPATKDMSRLDERFRFPAGALEVLTRGKTREALGLSEEAWKALPDYRDWGFCVFKLKQGAAQKVHPMALRFPTRWPGKLFFPTVHVHEGQWTPKAGFDHRLYAQGGLDHAHLDEWRESPGPAAQFVKVDQAQGLVLGDQHVLFRELRGELVNQDTVVALQ